MAFTIGRVALLRDRPCRVVETAQSRTGKHGYAKIHAVGLDLFTYRRVEDIVRSDHRVQVPQIERQQWLCFDVEAVGDGDDLLVLALLLDNDGCERRVRVAPELGEELVLFFQYCEDAVQAIVMKYGEDELVISTQPIRCP